MFKLEIKGLGASGSNFHVNGKSKLDRYRFQRDPKDHNKHFLLVPDDQWPTVGPDIYYDGQTVAILPTYIYEPGRADQAALAPMKEQLAELQKKDEKQSGQIANLMTALEKARGELVAAQGKAPKTGPNPELLAFREDYNTMVDLLKGIAIDGEDGPLTVLKRIVSDRTTGNAPVTESTESEKPPVASTPEPEPQQPPAAPAPPAGPVIYARARLQRMGRPKLDPIAQALGIAAHEYGDGAALLLIDEIIKRQDALPPQAAAA